MKILGFDHADIRVSSVVAVEAFYDALLPQLGLSRKADLHVSADGEWGDADDEHPRNAIEYGTPAEAGSAGWFVGFVEVPTMVPTQSRLAFALDDEANLPDIEALVRSAGGCVIERSSDENYPALFFEDPAGTRLEICARRPHV